MAALSDYDIVVVALERPMIEDGCVSEHVNMLQVFERSMGRKGRQSLVMMVDGYDSDPREIYTIPGVRDHLRAITSQWSNWGYFLKPDWDAMWIQLCLMPPTAPVHAGEVSTVVGATYGEMMDFFDTALSAGAKACCRRYERKPDVAYAQLRESYFRALRGARP